MRKGRFYLVIGILAIASIRSVVSIYDTPDSNPAPTSSPTVQPLGEGLGDTTALAAGQALKRSARNPGSLVVGYAVASRDGKYLCIDYRGQNGFGGMSRESVVFQDGEVRRGAVIWKKHCMNDDMRDVKKVVEVGMRMS